MDTNKSNGAAVDIEMGVTEATSDESTLANWIVDIEARVGNTKMVSQEELLWKTTSIYKVPAFKRELNPRAFTPMFVSFGPFHHGSPELEKMEVHKERALVHFLKRTNQSLQNIKREVAKIIAELRDAYCCLDDRWKANDEEFLKMMVLDGCFTLEILQKLDVLRKGIFDESDYSDVDPYFSLHAANHNWPYIKRDMLLIENQLPLLLLRTLLHFDTSNREDREDINCNINRLVLNLVAEYEKTPTSKTIGLHALDLFRHSLISLEPQPQQTRTETQSRPPQRLRCATKLYKAGVRFNRSETNKHKNIRFNSLTGKFRLPSLTVDDTTECSLINVIAFEYLHVNMAPNVTTYVTVMDEIIDSADDVLLLHEKGLILNSLESDEQVARIFNSVAKEITMHHDGNLSRVVHRWSSFRRWIYKIKL